MRLFAGVYALALVSALFMADASADEATVTDVNIVTGLDISYSVTPDEIKMEIASMARALRDPRVIRAIQAGPRRRIGFAMFAWHHDQFPVIVPWTLIESDRDAFRVADAIATRGLTNIELELRRQVAWYIGRLTDLSQAVDHAGEMLSGAPFASDRAVVNIVGNGEDNVGDDADVARDRFVQSGGTLNGIVLGTDPKVVDYFERKVIGGPHAFVMSTAGASSLADAFVRKFLGDIVAAAQGSAILR
jgi:hypothetical protein